jgi:hypothetical protein
MRLSMTAITVSALLTGSAVAQTPDQAANSGAGDSSNTVQAGNTMAADNSGTAGGSAALAERLSDGTLAESANTTALATSTYHQPTGFLPGMKP